EPSGPTSKGAAAVLDGLLKQHTDAVHAVPDDGRGRHALGCQAVLGPAQMLNVDDIECVWPSLKRALNLARQSRLPAIARMQRLSGHGRLEQVRRQPWPGQAVG